MSEPYDPETVKTSSGVISPAPMASMARRQVIIYTEDPVPAKCQNRMSASDMFRLVSYLLRVYPQVKDITSLREAVLSSNGYTAKNTKHRNLLPLLQGDDTVVRGSQRTHSPGNGKDVLRRDLPCPDGLHGQKRRKIPIPSCTICPVSPA